MTIPRPTPEQLELWMRDTTGPLVFADPDEEPPEQFQQRLQQLRAEVLALRAEDTDPWEDDRE